MIIPIRCKTCGKPINNKYREFISKRIEILKNNTIEDKDKNIRLLFDNLGIYRYCCRSIMNSHVELLPLLN